MLNMEIELQLCNNTRSLAALELPLHHTESGVSPAAAAPISFHCGTQAASSAFKTFVDSFILFVLISSIFSLLILAASGASGISDGSALSILLIF